MEITKIDSLLKELYDDIHSIKLDNEKKSIDDIYSLYDHDSEKVSYLNLDSTKKVKTPVKKSIFSNILRKLKKTKKIHKIVSEYSFTGSKDLLPFRKQQIFFVLQENDKDGTYFVSTCEKNPFSESSVSGYVPMSYFRKL